MKGKFLRGKISALHTKAFVVSYNCLPNWLVSRKEAEDVDGINF